MKLEPNGIGGERSERQPRPLDRPFAFLDPLIARGDWPGFADRLISNCGPGGAAYIEWYTISNDILYRLVYSQPRAKIKNAVAPVELRLFGVNDER